MNIFRFFGDLSHLASCLILLYSIDKNKSTRGLSLKTQVLYALVFITRYLDLFTKYRSFYLTLMKLFFLGSSFYTVYVMTTRYHRDVQENVDTFPAKYLLGASFVFAIFTTRLYTFMSILWTFSIWLESVAILPQLFVLQRTGEAENITTHYIFALGLYRALYIPNWFYRYFFENRFDGVSILAGILQTAIYSDFFYIYYTKVLHGKKFSLPV